MQADNLGLFAFIKVTTHSIADIGLQFRHGVGFGEDGLTKGVGGVASLWSLFYEKNQLAHVFVSVNVFYAVLSPISVGLARATFVVAVLPQASPITTSPSAAGDCRLTQMNIPVLIEKDKITERYSAVVPGLPGCASAGDTEAEALENIKEAIALWFEPAVLKHRA